jgi:sulfate transport system permease protein
MSDAVLATLAPPFTPRPDYWRRWRESSALPGFKLAFGFTLFYVGLVILLPLAALVARPWEHGVSGFVDAISGPRTLAALRLSFFGAAFAAAWVLTRYEFPGRSVLDALVDLPFALPTAVAGVALATLYGPNGWIGAPLLSIGVKVAYTPLGVFVALLAVGLPYVVRSVQPVLEDMEAALEEAAQTLGASTWQVASRIVLPALAPALLSGFAMAFARGAGEYGSVIFIAGNMPGVSEIAPLVIVSKLEQYDYSGAAAVGVAMLLISLLALVAINIVQVAYSRRGER